VKILQVRQKWRNHKTVLMNAPSEILELQDCFLREVLLHVFPTRVLTSYARFLRVFYAFWRVLPNDFHTKKHVLRSKLRPNKQQQQQQQETTMANGYVRCIEH
jgi:hypothetical protein